MLEADLQISASREKSENGEKGESYNGAISISWEVDLWGKLGDSTRAAAMDEAEQRELYYSARNTLMAEVMKSWLTLITAQHDIEIEKARLETLTRNEQYVLQRYANVVKAKASLACTLKDLECTRITAPLDGLVIKRLASPGSYMQVGAEVASLYSTDRVEVAVSLDSEEWGNLPAHEALVESSWPVEVRVVDIEKTWSGYVLRTEQHLDETTRQRTLVVAVDKPFDQSPPLLGEYQQKVQVPPDKSLTGRSVVKPEGKPGNGSPNPDGSRMQAPY